ncbi:MAG: hypothetical protein V4671_20245, partial [Armatimonadota bacterium]
MRFNYGSGAALGLMTLGLSGLLSGCGSGGPPPPDVNEDGVVAQPGWSVRSQTRALGQKKWTFLVYMNAA